MKIKIFKKEKSFKKGGFHTNPDICWEVVLYVAFALVVGILVFSFFLFKKTNKEFVTPAESSLSQTKTIKKERIEKVLEYFSEREKKSTGILNSSPQLVDPSL